MRRSMMTSLFAIAGMVLAVMQMVRKNRTSPWSSMMFRMNHAGQDVLRSVNQMMRTVRRRVKA